MLLNEFLKEHRAFLKEQRKIEGQEATITQLKQDFQSKLVEQQKQIKVLTTGLQKVSAQLAAASSSHGGLEVDKRAPRIVDNHQ
jgi:t-SNARE complex subunit (syntaxin)